MLREWIQNIVVFLLMMTLIGQLIPEDKYRKYVRLIMGMILIMVLLMPITKIAGMEETIYQNFVRNQMQISASDAQVSGKIFENELKFNESYKQIIMDEIDAYFEVSAMNVQYCQIDMNDSVDSDHYGEIYSIHVGIMPKDRHIEESEEVTSVYVERIEIGENRIDSGSTASVPEEKIKEWQQDLSLQFGVAVEQVYLEIVS